MTSAFCCWRWASAPSFAFSSTCRAKARARRRRSQSRWRLRGFVYVLALMCFAVAGVLLARRGRRSPVARGSCSGAAATCCNSSTPHCMFTNWSILARMSLGEKAVDDHVFLFAVGSSR